MATLKDLFGVPSEIEKPIVNLDNGFTMLRDPGNPDLIHIQKQTETSNPKTGTPDRVKYDFQFGDDFLKGRFDLKGYAAITEGKTTDDPVSAAKIVPVMKDLIAAVMNNPDAATINVASMNQKIVELENVKPKINPPSPKP
jgi:hypothetical protein